MTVLVTGGAGFIGSHFVSDWLAAGGERIVTLDKLTYAGSRENLAGLERNKGHLFIEGDIADGALLRRILADHAPRAIVNFAAESHVDRSIAGPSAFIDTNIVGTFELLEAAREMLARPAAGREAFRFLHVSTDEVFGALGPGDRPVREDAPFRPNSPYSAAKAASDHLVRAYGHTYGVAVLTTHCTNNYGPRQHPEKLIPVVIEAARRGRPIPIYANGENIRDWLHVGDHCAALRLVLERGRPGETYNIGAHNEVRNIDLVLSICAILDELTPGDPVVPHRRLMSEVADRPGHDFRYALDAGKLRDELGWTPRTGFAEGLRACVGWYLDNPGWVESMLARAAVAAA